MPATTGTARVPVPAASVAAGWATVFTTTVVTTSVGLERCESHQANPVPSPAQTTTTNPTASPHPNRFASGGSTGGPPIGGDGAPPTTEGPADITPRLPLTGHASFGVPSGCATPIKRASNPKR